MSEWFEKVDRATNDPELIEKCKNVAPAFTIYPRGRDHHERPCYMSADGKELWLSEETATEEANLKHFSNAELAAEFWRAEAVSRGPYPSQRDKIESQLRVIARFAVTPHYWQERPKTSIVSLMTGLSAEELDELGGVPE